MIQRSTVLAVALTLAVAFATPVAAGTLGLSGASDGTDAVVGTAQSATPENNTTASNNESDNGSMAPGAKLAGVVSVQGTEVSGEIEHRALGHRMAAARSNASKASVIASQSSELSTRLSDIRAQQQTLQAKYENGTISTGQYKARMAKLVAEARTIQRLLNTTADAAAGLPNAALEAKGVNVTAIETLRTDAKNLTGPEVAAIAQEVAGNRSANPPGLGNGTGGPGAGPGEAPGNGPGSGNGQPADPGNGSQGPANESSRNATNSTPGQGNGPPGNGPPGNSTPGNGTNVTVVQPDGNVTFSLLERTAWTLFGA